MTRMICRRWRGCAAGLLCFGLTPLCAQETLPEQGAWNSGALSGYAWGDRDLDSVPVNFHIGYTLFKGKPRLPLPAGALEVAVEPFFAAVTRHSDREGADASLEAGLMLGVFSYHIDLGRGWSPYLEGGVGILRHDFEGYKLGGGFQLHPDVGRGPGRPHRRRLVPALGLSLPTLVQRRTLQRESGPRHPVLHGGFALRAPRSLTQGPPGRDLSRQPRRLP